MQEQPTTWLANQFEQDMLTDEFTTSPDRVSRGGFKDDAERDAEMAKRRRRVEQTMNEENTNEKT